MAEKTARRRRGSSRPPQPLPPRRWLLALAATVAAGFSITHALALATVNTSPAAAAALAPYDGRILSEASEALFTGASSQADRERAVAFAQRALMRDPTSAESLTVLALSAQLANRSDRTRALFARSAVVSRRELQPHLWLIEEAVGRGDIRTALHHYDLALRTSRSAQALLFPVLSAAIANGDIRAALLPILAKGPLWRENFVGYAVTSRVAPSAIAALMGEMQRARVPVDSAQRAALVDVLLERGAGDEAWSLYASLHPDAARIAVRPAALDGPATRLDWHLSEDASGLISLAPAEGGGLAIFGSPPPEVSVVEQWQLLPAGRYRLTQAGPGAGTGARVSLRCRDGRDLAAGPLDARNVLDVVVPTGCPVQVLAISAGAGPVDSGSGLRIGPIGVMSLGGAQ